VRHTPISTFSRNLRSPFRNPLSAFTLSHHQNLVPRHVNKPCLISFPHSMFNVECSMFLPFFELDPQVSASHFSPLAFRSPAAGRQTISNSTFRISNSCRRQAKRIQLTNRIICAIFMRYEDLFDYGDPTQLVTRVSLCRVRAPGRHQAPKPTRCPDYSG